MPRAICFWPDKRKHRHLYQAKAHAKKIGGHYYVCGNHYHVASGE